MQHRIRLNMNHLFPRVNRHKAKQQGRTSEQIQGDIDAFLADGNKITQVPFGEQSADYGKASKKARGDY